MGDFRNSLAASQPDPTTASGTPPRMPRVPLSRPGERVSPSQKLLQMATANLVARCTRSFRRTRRPGRSISSSTHHSPFTFSAWVLPRAAASSTICSRTRRSRSFRCAVLRHTIAFPQALASRTAPALQSLAGWRGHPQASRAPGAGALQVDARHRRVLGQPLHDAPGACRLSPRVAQNAPRHGTQRPACRGGGGRAVPPSRKAVRKK